MAIAIGSSFPLAIIAATSPDDIFVVLWSAGLSHATEPVNEPIPRHPHLDQLQFRSRIEIRGSAADTVVMIRRIINGGDFDVSVFGQFVLSGGWKPASGPVRRKHGTGPRFYFLGPTFVGCAKNGMGIDRECREFHVPARGTVFDTVRFHFYRSDFEQQAGSIDVVLSFWRWRGRVPQAGDTAADLGECLADSIAVLSIAVP